MEYCIWCDKQIDISLVGTFVVDDKDNFHIECYKEYAKAVVKLKYVYNNSAE